MNMNCIQCHQPVPPGEVACKTCWICGYLMAMSPLVGVLIAGILIYLGVLP